MKKIVAIFAAFIMASAMAGGRENIFEGTTFNDLKPQLEADGVLKDGRFPTMVLAKAVAGILKTEGKTNVREDLVAQAWIQHYKWPQTMTAAEYDQTQFYVDDDFIAKVNQAGGGMTPAKAVPVVDAQVSPAQPPAAATQPAEPEKKVATTPPTPPVQSTEGAISDALRILNGKVAALEKAGNDVGAIKAELMAVAKTEAEATVVKQYEEMAKRLTTLNASVAKLEGRLTTVEAAQTQTTKLVTTQAGSIEKVAGAVTTLSGAVSAQGKAVSTLDSRLKTVEDKVGGNAAVWLIVPALALLLSLFAVFRKRGGGVDLKQVEQVAKEEATKVAQAEATKTAKNIDDKIDAAVNEMKDSRAEVMEEVTKANRTADAALKAVKGTGVWFDFDDSFELALAAAEAGQTVFWHTTYSVEGVPVEVAVSLVPKADGFVNLGGVKNLSVGKGCRLDKVAVKTALRKAAQRGDLVGLSSEELAELQTPAQPNFADTEPAQPDIAPAAAPKVQRTRVVSGDVASAAKSVPNDAVFDMLAKRSAQAAKAA